MPVGDAQRGPNYLFMHPCYQDWLSIYLGILDWETRFRGIFIPLILFSLQDFVRNAYFIPFITFLSCYRASHIFSLFRIGTPAFSKIAKLIARYFLAIENLQLSHIMSSTIRQSDSMRFPADRSINCISFICERITLKSRAIVSVVTNQKQLTRYSDLFCTWESMLIFFFILTGE